MIPSSVERKTRASKELRKGTSAAQQLPVRHIHPLILILVLLSCHYVAGQTPPLGGASQQQRQDRAAKVETVGCLSNESGKLKLTDEDGNVYYLIGRTAWLKNHLGDQLAVTGIEAHPPERPTDNSVPETTLRVSDVQTVLHRNPSGVRPLLGDPSSWRTSTNRTYGVGFRFPKTFEVAESQDASVQSNFVTRYPSAAVPIENLTVPEDTYPSSNFHGGRFDAMVDPSIDNRGTCEQFTSFWPEHSSLRTIRGIEYTQTLFVEGSTAHASPLYYFHTFQNGLCYEFDFEFFEADGTGMMLPCEIQWVSEKNEFELMESVLSRIAFVKPEFKPVREPKRTVPPVITSFTPSPVTFDSLERVTVSWSSEGADSVRIRYQCVKGLSILGPDGSEEMKCGQLVPRNLDPVGSATFVLLNQSNSPSSLSFVVTVEPFVNGAGYAKNSKSLSIPVIPHSLPSRKN
jgi:hypothetical protein